MPEDSPDEGHQLSFIGKIKEKLTDLLSRGSAVRDSTSETPSTSPPLSPFSPKDEWRVPVERIKRSAPAKAALKDKSPNQAQQSGSKRVKTQQLYNKYRHLVDERNQINQQKTDLTLRVDIGELSSEQTHKQMVSLTREAAQLAEVIRELEVRLAELGHPRFKDKS